MEPAKLLSIVSVGSIAIALSCSIFVIIDILLGNRQKMRVMNVVWPLTTLYAGPIALLAYFKLGRIHVKGHEMTQAIPFWQSVCLATTHCGSGCTLGDLISESAVAFFPIVVFGRKLFGSWIVDFVAAFIFGILFQYFTIKPMKNLSPSDGLKAALKADSASLVAWQVGMYGWMAIASFLIFRRPLEKSDPVFWFMMQIAMLFGFITSFPVNWWLVGSGIKERM